MKVNILLFSAVFLFVLCESKLGEIKNIFGPHACIPGSISTISNKAVETFGIKGSSGQDVLYYSNHNTSVQTDNSEKSSLSQLHELAQYNAINYFFKLEKDEGPSHNKLFTVKLTLGNEEYMGEGTSLKRAQQSAAASALLGTEYEHPLPKDMEKNNDALTPTVLLNNLSAKLGFAVSYFLIDKDKQISLGKKSKKSYLLKLNDTIHQSMRVDESQLKGPFKIKVEVGDNSFYGVALTIQSARHDAATKAVDFLLKQVQAGESVCLKEGSEAECKMAKASLKSPVSLVYESGQSRKLSVEFEIIDESGPPHKKVFITECRLGDLTTVGEGHSKKESKKAAALKMLERLPELPDISQDVQVISILNKDGKIKKKRKKNKIIKTNFEQIAMNVENFVNSVLDFGEQKNENPTDHTSKKSKTNNRRTQSYQNELLELSDYLNFEIQFADENDDDLFYTIMSLNLNPEYICLGQGTSGKLAREKAAIGGLKLLGNIEFEEHFRDKKYILLEREVKTKIEALLSEISNNES